MFEESHLTKVTQKIFVQDDIFESNVGWRVGIQPFLPPLLILRQWRMETCVLDTCLFPSVNPTNVVYH